MAGVIVQLDDLFVRISRDPDAPSAGGTGVISVVEQEPAVSRFRDIEASEGRCIRV